MTPEQHSKVQAAAEALARAGVFMEEAARNAGENIAATMRRVGRTIYQDGDGR